MKRFWNTLLRLSITGLGLWFAARQIDFNQLFELLAQADWRWVAAGFMLVNFSMAVRAWRWQRLLFGAGASRPGFGRLVELYFVGNFFNAFLPSGFGGDVVRAFEVTRELPADVAGGTVFLDRLTGLMVLFFLSLIALPFRPAEFPVLVARLVFWFSLGGLVASFVLLDGRLVKWLGQQKLAQRLPRAISPTGEGAMAKFLAAVSSCGWPAIWQAILISGIFSQLLVAWWMMATFALGTPVSFGYCLLVVPIMGVAQLVPTFGGLGVREMIAPVLFLGAGLSDAAAVSIPLIDFMMVRGSGLLGAPIYLFSIWNQKHSA